VLLGCVIAAGRAGGAVADPGSRYPEHPPVAHTGGFDEPTCHRCHFDQPLGAPGGRLRSAGFQLSARVEQGARKGQQAGGFRVADGRAEVTPEEGVDYVHHTLAGSVLAGRDTTSWTVAWTSPEGGTEAIVFHVAANAANDDASAFGDFVYVAERLVCMR
jgi:hypothetical protein